MPIQTTSSPRKAYFTWVGAALAAAFFFAFVLDYLHSISKTARACYSHGTFIADLGLVVLMFIAGQKILGTPIFPSVEEFWFLGAARLCGWFWEHMKADAANVDPTPEGIDLLFIFVYAIGGLIAVQIGWYAQRRVPVGVGGRAVVRRVDVPVVPTLGALDRQGEEELDRG